MPNKSEKASPRKFVGPTTQTGPFKCIKCPKEFNNIKALNGHARMHSITTCGKCQEKFSSMGQYHFHLAIAHKKINRCAFCSFKTDNAEKLLVHLVLHPENKETASKLLEGFMLEDDS